jgi:hypothetical protein
MMPAKHATDAKPVAAVSDRRPPTTHDLVREHALAAAGVFTRVTLNELRRTEWSPEFEQLMRNRLIIGALRYGRIHGPRPRYDYVGDAQRRLALYAGTGNTELLVDVANEMLLAWLHDDHPNKHFRSNGEDAGHCALKR